MKPLLLAALPALSLLIAHPCSAQSTWIVDQQGGGDFTAIQEAIDSPSVADGDTVLVLPGTYEENVSTADKSLVLRSDRGAAVTTIDGGGVSSGVRVFGDATTIVLDGFTITNGLAWDGGGVAILPSGGGVSVQILNCVIEGNHADGGGGGVIVARGANATLRNCLIQRNTVVFYAGGGLVLFDSGTVALIDGCTIRGNSAGTAGGGIYDWSGAQVNVVSSVVANNWVVQQGYEGNVQGNLSRYVGQHSLIVGSANWCTAGCLDTDPLFADDGTGLAPLSSIAAGQAMDSPAIDAGNPDARPVGTTRTDGIPDCGRADMGYHAPVECGYEPFCIAAWNSTGQPAEIGACGSTSIAANDLTLRIEQAPPGQFGLFFYGADETFTIFGEGALCVAAPFARVLPVIATDGTGSASLPLDLGNDPFTVAPNTIAPFETWRFQFWYRDPLGGPSGFNLSDGLAVTFCP